MPPFNQPLPANDPTRTIGFSKGRVSQKDFDKGDDSLSILFEGAANVGATTIGLTDQIIQNEISRDVTKSVDEIREGFVDPNVVLAEGQALPSGSGPDDPPLPAEVKQAEGRMQTLRTALDQDKISETSYYSQILSEVRRVRSRFPGYRDHIDTVTKRVVGTDPANAIVREVFRESASRQSQAQAAASRDQANARSLAAQGLISGYDFREWEVGRTDLNDLYGKVASRQAKVKFMTDEKKMMEADDSLRTRYGRTQVSLEMQEVEKEVLASLGIENSPDLGAMLINVAKTGQSDPDTTRSLTTAAQSIIAAQQQVVDNYIEKNPDLPEEQKKEFRDMIEAKRQAYAQAILGKDDLPGFAGMDGLYTSALEEEVLSEHLANSDNDQLVRWTLQGKYPEASKQIWSNYPLDDTMSKRSFKAVIDKAGQTIVRKRPIGQVLQELDSATISKGMNSSNRAGIKGIVIDSAVRSIKEANDQNDNPEGNVDAIMPPEGAAFPGIDRNSWGEYYKKLVSPSNIEVLKPAFQSNKAVAKKYSDGLMKHWRVLYKQQLDDVQRAATLDEDFRLGVEDDGTLTITGFSPLNRVPSDFGFGEEIRPIHVSDAQRSIDDLNSSFLNTQNALQATGMVDQQGRDLHFSLVDQVVQTGNGQAYAELRADRAANPPEGGEDIPIRTGVEVLRQIAEETEPVPRALINGLIERFGDDMEAMDRALTETFGEAGTQIMEGIRQLNTSVQDTARGVDESGFPFPEAQNFGGRGAVAAMLRDAYQQLPQSAPAKEAIENFLVDEFMMSEGGELQGEVPPTAPKEERENVRKWLQTEQGT